MLDGKDQGQLSALTSGGTNKNNNVDSHKLRTVKSPTVFLSYTQEQEMATASTGLLCEDQFLCSICLSMFKDPVSTPCGHNFCKACITGYWDTTVIYQCPLCKTVFTIRPDLKVNTFISELAAQFTRCVKVTDSSSPVQTLSSPGEVVCDVCTDPKLNAVKSCLECLASYCGTHLEPHQMVKGLQKHTLIDPVENLEDRVCQEHNRLLTLFCRTERVTLCDFCIGTHSQDHKLVPVQVECREKRSQLGQMETQVQGMIQERLQKLQEFKGEVEQNQDYRENEIARIVQEYSSVTFAIEKSQAELIGVVDKKLKAAEKRARDHVQDLEQEINELQGLSTKLKELLGTKDKLKLLQNFQSQSIPPNTKDWSAIMVKSGLGTEPIQESLRRITIQLKIAVDQLSKDMKKICDTQMLSAAALRRMRQYAVDVVLDPSTAHPNLVLSSDGKQVAYHFHAINILLLWFQTEKVFCNHLAVLGTMGFSSGKFYFEVSVRTKTEWIIGVANESVNRRWKLPRHPDCGLWALMFILDRYEAYHHPGNNVNWRKMEKVGVFVDYAEGCVSFYDVEASCLICSFTGCNFTERIFPYLNPCDNVNGDNLAPLVITAVSHT